MSTTTLTKKRNLSLDLTKKVSIRQYVDPDVFNMGMEKYNMSVFSGESGSGGHKEWLGYKQIGNVQTYLTGLDVNASSVRELSDDKREQKETEINAVLEYLKGTYGSEVLLPTNASFWGQHYLELRKPVIGLNLQDIKDLITYYNILGGGYSEVAYSFEEAKTSNKIYKFYLHIDSEVSDSTAELKKLRNKSRKLLEEIDNTDSEKLFKVAKLLLPIEKGYTRKTAKSLIYSDLDDFISGDYMVNAKKEAPGRFLEVVEKDKASLNLEALVRECLYQRYITTNNDQMFWNFATQVTYGRSENEVIGFLTNPMNNDELLFMVEKVDKIWK